MGWMPIWKARFWKRLQRIATAEARGRRATVKEEQRGRDAAERANFTALTLVR